MSDIEAMDELLVAFGVDVTDPLWRNQKATALVNAGVSPLDAETVFSHIEKTTSDLDKVPAAVAALAKNPDRLEEAIPAIVAYRASQDARKGVGKDSLVPGKSQWVDPRQMDPDHQWAHSTNRRIAYARVYADRRPVDSVAVEMGLSVAQVKKLADEERKDRMKDVPQAVRSHLTPEQEKWRDEWLKMTPQQRRAAVLDAAKKQKVTVAP